MRCVHTRVAMAVVGGVGFRVQSSVRSPPPPPHKKTQFPNNHRETYNKSQSTTRGIEFQMLYVIFLDLTRQTTAWRI